jgi:hypothetical protein
MKMLFENWRGFVNEQAEIIDFPAPESRGDDEEYFLFSKEQINILDKVVKDFGGSLDGIVQKSSSEAERLVAEEDSEGEEDEGTIGAVEKPYLRSLPRPPRKSKKPFFKMEPEDFETEGYVIAVKKDILDYFNTMFEELRKNTESWESSKRWYYDVNNVIKAFVDNNSEDVALLSIIMSACSHNTPFERNFAEAILVFKAIKADLANGKKDCLLKFLDDSRHFKKRKVKGKMGKLKLTNFALNILDPKLSENPDNWWNSTMDRWMIRAFYPTIDETQFSKGSPEAKAGGKLVMKIAGAPISYVYLAKYLARFATQLDLTPSELQAIIWISIMNKRRGRVDTLPEVLRILKTKNLSALGQIASSIEQTGDQQEAIKIVELFKKNLNDEQDIIKMVYQMSSEQKREILDSYINPYMDLDSEDCPVVTIEKEVMVKGGGTKTQESVAYPSLLTYFVLDYHVGMRKDKKNNIRDYVEEAITGKLDVDRAREMLVSLIGFDATKQTQLISEKLDRIAEELRRMR